MGEQVRAFVPDPLPPANPPLALRGPVGELHAGALAALSRLAVAGTMVPSTDWFLYGFVRKEAVITSQIEGTQATLPDVVTFEATDRAERFEDVQEVGNYVDALTYARVQLTDPNGLPLSIRLLRDTHRILMSGGRGADKQPGEVRRSQNWIGGRRPGTARFVPPPPEDVPAALAALERWWHAESDLPPLVRAGLAHVQFETIHPFLDGNGRIGRLLIALLIEHSGMLDQPLLYLSVAFRRAHAGPALRPLVADDQHITLGDLAFSNTRAAMLADGDTRSLEHRPVGGKVALDDQDAAGGFERAVDGVDHVLVGELHLHVLEANTALHILLHTFAIAGLHYGCDSVARPSDRAHSC